jgi:hypothetical protein
VDVAEPLGWHLDRVHWSCRLACYLSSAAMLAVSLATGISHHMTCVPACASPWKALNTAFLYHVGIRGCGTPLDTSQSRLAPITSMACSEREGDLLASSIAWHPGW